MIFSLCLASFVLKGAVDASPLTDRLRRGIDFADDAEVSNYCSRHAAHFRHYCIGDNAGSNTEILSMLLKFCVNFQRHCGLGKGEAPARNRVDLLIVPPPLPRGKDFARLDLPLGSQEKPKSLPFPSTAEASERLTAAMIASCTPECTAAHCTDACKCANTHPKVHSVCNPPPNAEMASTCQRWYTKCPMFKPVQY